MEVLNETHLALARQLSAKEGVAPKFEVGDLRAIGFKDAFALIINVGTSFGFFEFEEDNASVIEGVAKALTPKGLLC